MGDCPGVVGSALVGVQVRDVQGGDGEEGVHEEVVREGYFRDRVRPEVREDGGGCERVGGRDGEVVEELEVWHAQVEVYGVAVEYGRGRRGLGEEVVVRGGSVGVGWRWEGRRRAMRGAGCQAGKLVEAVGAVSVVYIGAGCCPASTVSTIGSGFIALHRLVSGIQDARWAHGR